ncbi:hypothetical protein [Puniceibacterium sediminis]|uniref:Uncharacterized protein n=1 Tax=Puniceibacterium sediminis TaxID=1608407 RepID=A0A238XAK9_9RHOB|nr:hypothetical protein [Puniceibacterium sediminis]SNR55601.1 hypothetical protein SAMN06265370_11032 [Puniceibacterium sediminis]
MTEATKYQELAPGQRDNAPQGGEAQRIRFGGRQRDGWYVAKSQDSYVLSRHWPAQFDVRASTRLPRLRASRLARQIRQDIWRELQGLRGFSPVVQIVEEDAGMTVYAGGQLMAGPVPNGTQQRIQALLDDPARRARWSLWARNEGQG